MSNETESPTLNVGRDTPSSAGEIHVTPQTIYEPATAKPPGPLRAKLIKSLQDLPSIRKSQPASAEPAKAPASSEPTQPAAPTEKETPLEDPGTETQQDPNDEVEPESPAEDDQTSAVEKKAKKNPWKLYESARKEARELKQKVQELESSRMPPEKKTEYEQHIESLRKSVEQQEEIIRLTNYTQSREFQDKYVQPWTEQYQLAAEEISELRVTDEQGNARQATMKDIDRLLELSPMDAQEEAEAMFGKLANQVLQHRNKLVSMRRAHAKAIENAKASAVKHNQEMTQRQQQLQAETREQMEKINSELLANESFGKYFKPVEGDEKWNSLLQKGYRMVDEVYNSNPLSPDLTSEQRVAVLKKHAALRHRAAAFGPLRQRYESAQAEIKTLKSQLDEYRTTEPSTGGSKQSTEQPTEPANRRTRIREGLLKFAK